MPTAAGMGRKKKASVGKENTQVTLVWSGPRERQGEERNIPGGGGWSERADIAQQNLLPKRCFNTGR